MQLSALLLVAPPTGFVPAVRVLAAESLTKRVWGVRDTPAMPSKRTAEIPITSYGNPTTIRRAGR